MFGSAKRPLKFAGTWYSASAELLAQQIDQFIDSVRAKVATRTPLFDKNMLALIAPHAGYMYSGQTAAASYLPAGS